MWMRATATDAEARMKQIRERTNTPENSETLPHSQNRSDGTDPMIRAEDKRCTIDGQTNQSDNSSNDRRAIRLREEKRKGKSRAIHFLWVERLSNMGPCPRETSNSSGVFTTRLCLSKISHGRGWRGDIRLLVLIPCRQCDDAQAAGQAPCT